MEYEFIAGDKGLTSEPLGKVTLEDVKKAAERLAVAGMPVNTRSVHAEIGRGSRSTIVAHMRAVREPNVSADTHGVPVLSPEMARDLAREIDRLVKEKTSRLSTDLADARESLDLVVQENEIFRIALADADVRVATLRASMAEQVGGVTTLRSQIEALSGQLEPAKLEAQVARQEVAVTREQLRASEDRCARLASEQSVARDELADVRRELARAKEEVETGKRECVTLQAQVAFLQQTEAHLKQSAARAQLLQAELEEARTRLSASEAERTGLAERLGDAKHSLSCSEATLQQLLGKVLQQVRTGESQGGSS